VIGIAWGKEPPSADCSRKSDTKNDVSTITERIRRTPTCSAITCFEKAGGRPASGPGPQPVGGDVTDERTVDAAAFRDAMKPTVDALRAFANAVDDLEARSRPPAADSRAMSEIAAEQALSERSDWDDPLSTTHGSGALTLRAASDYVRGFAELFTAETRMPMWAHLVLARGS
jgi:hypothetical protein